MTSAVMPTEVMIQTATGWIKIATTLLGAGSTPEIEVSFWPSAGGAAAVVGASHGAGMMMGGRVFDNAGKVVDSAKNYNHADHHGTEILKAASEMINGAVGAGGQMVNASGQVISQATNAFGQVVNAGMGAVSKMSGSGGAGAAGGGEHGGQSHESHGGHGGGHEGVTV